MPKFLIVIVLLAAGAADGKASVRYSADFSLSDLQLDADQIEVQVQNLIADQAQDQDQDQLQDQDQDQDQDQVQIRYYQDGRSSVPPVSLRDSAGVYLSRGHRQAVKDIRRALAENYAESGFFSAVIDSVVLAEATEMQREGMQDVQVISVFSSPGCRFRIGAVNYEILDNDRELLQGYLGFYGENDPFDQLVLQNELRRMVRHLEQKGYPLARIEILAFEPDKESCLVALDVGIWTGEEFHVEGVLTGGLRQFNAGYVETATGIREGEKITPDLFRRGRRNLENTDFFSDVSRGDIVIRDGETYVYYDVVERRANHFDLMFGYVPRQVDGYNIVGRGEMIIRNVGWPGSTMHLNFERLDDMVTRLASGIDRQWMLGLPFGAGVDFRFVQQDTSYQVREFQLKGSYHRTPERIYSMHLSQQNTSANDHPALAVSVLDGVKRAAGFGFRFDNTDSRFSPQRGMIFDLYVESGFRRITDSRADELRSRGTMLQQQVHSTLKTFYSPFARQILAFQLNGAIVESPEYTETDLMTLGGARSVRGYREEQFRVARTAWADLEYRYLLDPVSHAFIFGVLGGYERPAMLGREEGSTSEWIYSGGLGFRYQTPIGLMQFTYAVSADDPLHNGKVHFSLTAGF